MKKASVLVAIFVVGSLLSLGLTFVPEATATVFYVGGAGPGNHTTIQEAIDDASPGDTVYVFGGIYHENVIVNKTLSLVGDDMDAVTIDGNETGDVVHVSADWVDITGFTVRNSSRSLELFPHFAGVRLDSVTNCRISNSNISDNEYGVLVVNSSGIVIAENVVTSNYKEGIAVTYSGNSTVSGNHVSDNWGVGIFILDSDTNAIVNNTVSANTRGILLYSSWLNNVTHNSVSSLEIGINVRFSNTNSVFRNSVSGNGDYGIYVWQSKANTFSYNSVSNSGSGIYLGLSEGNTVSDSNLSHNDVGVVLEDSENNTIARNTILSNAMYGVYLNQSANNRIFLNDFVDNAEQAFDDNGGNQWDRGYPLGGNYWSDYVGMDKKGGPNQDEPGSDGIGDIPYEIDADTSDAYPLVRFPQGEEVSEESIFEQAWFWAAVAVGVAVILLVVLSLVRRRKGKQREGEPPETK
ncbi:MAG: nitrous oxide reductase family maturation protein NosD [Thermoplasmata archaeon]